MDALSLAILLVFAVLALGIAAGIQTVRLGVSQERERRLTQEVRDLSERIAQK